MIKCGVFKGACCTKLVIAGGILHRGEKRDHIRELDVPRTSLQGQVGGRICGKGCGTLWQQIARGMLRPSHLVTDVMSLTFTPPFLGLSTGGAFRDLVSRLSGDFSAAAAEHMRHHIRSTFNDHHCLMNSFNPQLVLRQKTSI